MSFKQKTPQKTPLKIIKTRTNDNCRVCKINIKISGRSSINIFGEKSKKDDFLNRFARVAEAEITDQSGISQVICQKCNRTILKFEKTLEQVRELADFRSSYNETVGQLDTRTKRCAKDSPSCDYGPKKKVCENQAKTLPRRRILQPLHVSNESTATILPFASLPLNVEAVHEPKTSCTEVHINYPSRPVKTVIKNELDAAIIRQLASKEYKLAANGVWKHQTLKSEVLNKLHVDIEKECRVLCSEKDPSLLRKSNAEDLIAFSEKACEDEIRLKAPTFHGCMKAATVSRKTQGKVEAGKNNIPNTAPAIAMAASVLLKRRCPQMTAMGYRFAIGVLWHSGAKKQGYVRANHWNISASHSRTLMKLDEMGVQFDKDVKKWKTDVENHNLISEMLVDAKEYLKDQETGQNEFVAEGLQTTDISDLDLTFPLLDSYKDQDTFSNHSASTDNNDLLVMDMDFDDTLEETICNLDASLKNYLIETCGFSIHAYQNLVTFANSQDIDSLARGALDAVDIEYLQQALNQNQPVRYQVIGDNVDLYVKVKHMASDRQNKSIHWFAMNSVQNRVTSDNHNDHQIKSVLEMDNTEFLPSEEENNSLLHDFIPLAARVLADKVPAFKCFRETVVRHIPHMYSHEMKHKSVQVPLGLLFKNENLNDEMIEILEHIHTHYVPTKEMTSTDESGNTVTCREVQDSIFFGGDQLTEERARNAKDARGDGDTRYERLDGTISKAEDWHAVRLVYQILYDILYKPTSAGDTGSMCSNMNITNNINAKTTNVLDNFNYCKDYVEIETDAYICAAAMDHFKMDSLEDEKIVPGHIANATKKAKRLWLHQQTQVIVEKHIMEKQSLEYREISNAVNANETIINQRKVFLCSECGKSYFYKKARDTHEQQKHGKSLPISDSLPQKQSSTSPKEDHVYNYACVRLSLGMLLRNFNDAVKEGGQRTLRCWKFLMLIFKAHNHTKYALAALLLVANTQAILTPQQAHSLIWNRTVNNRGGSAANISLDLRMEHIVHLHKEMLSNLGVNLTPEAALRCSKAIMPVERLLFSIDEELQVKRPSGRHTVTRSERDFVAIVNELHTKGKVFANFEELREFQSFPNFRRSILKNLDYNKLNTWLNDHKKELSNRGF